jgi:hypothetical protein
MRGGSQHHNQDPVGKGILTEGWEESSAFRDYVDLIKRTSIATFCTEEREWPGEPRGYHA